MREKNDGRTKEKFLNELKNKLQGLPKSSIDERINFYSEMIDDRVEEGMTEEEAIADIGGINGVVADIAKDTPLVSLVKERIRPKRRISGLEIVLLILGFPLWFPLLIVGLILFLVGYFILWILEIVLYVVELSLIAAAVACLLAFALNLKDGNLYIFYLAFSFLGLGTSGILLFACFYSTKGVFKITKHNAIAIKSWFIRGGKNEKVC